MKALRFALLLVILPSAGVLADEKPRPPLWVAVGPAELLSPLAPLAEHREAQGLETLLLPGNDVRAALAAVPRPPSYLLLVGDDAQVADGDEPWLLRAESLDFYRWRNVQANRFASDVPYADHDGDGSPDGAVGRIPARDPAQVALVVLKTLAWEKRAPQPADLRVVAWAGAPGYGGPVDAFATNMLVGVVQNNAPRWAEAWMISGDAGSSLSGWPPLQPKLFVDAMREGSLLNAVVSHGNEISVFSMPWNDQGIGFHIEHGRRLLKDGDPLAPLVLISCSCGTFDADDITLAEQLLLLPGGPVVTVGATNESHPLPNYYTGQCLLKALAGEYGRFDRFGDIWLATQERAATAKEPMVEMMLKDVEGKLEETIDTDRLRADQRNLYAMFGDPATRLRMPAPVPLALTVTKTEAGWTWRVEKPEGATSLRVGLRAVSPGMAAPVASDADEATRRTAFDRANARFAFAPVAELDAQADWTGTIDRPGLLRAVATCSDGLRVAVAEVGG